MQARDGRALLARQTLGILEAGHYLMDERVVDIAADVRACVASTRPVLPDDLEALKARVVARFSGATPAVLELRGESTLAAAHRLAGRGFGRVGVLNFASARNPGGGFLGGSQAQEESLARSSALHASLTGPAATPFYDHHRGARSLLYSDRVLVSPGCPVFRDDAGALLPAPHRPTFLTCAAPNAGALAANEPAALPLVPGVFAARAAGLLAVAADAGCDALVLGAWGCGVFRNDPSLVAGIWRALLDPARGAFARCFRHVDFAVLDSTPARTCAGAFERAFAAAVVPS